MSNLNKINNTFHGHEKTHVNLFFHIHVGGEGKRPRYLLEKVGDKLLRKQ
jgi:hypothetical protein